MAQIREKVDLYNIKVELGTESESEISLVQVEEKDTEKWKPTLKIENLLWGNYDIEINRITVAYVKNDENFKKLVVDENGNVKSLYYIEENGSSSKKYVYNAETDIIYKVKQTTLGSKKIHSVEELDYLINGGTREKIVPSKNYTKISYDVQVKTVNGVSYYEPNLNNISKEPTSLVFYMIDGETVKTKEITAAEWLEKGRPREIKDGTETYVLYDYENKIWANIKVVKNGLETWWVWIPRYAYNASGTTEETDIIFVDTNNKPIDGSTLPSGYEVPGSFKNNQKKGIWGSKYEPTPTSN